MSPVLKPPAVAVRDVTPAKTAAASRIRGSVNARIVEFPP
jgi:hypothetical protein